MLDATTIDRQNLDALDAGQLRELAKQLAGEIQWRDAKIDKLTFELAQLKRVQFGVKSERLNAEQRALFEEAVAADIAALEEQPEQLTKKAGRRRQRREEKAQARPAAARVAKGGSPPRTG